LAIIEKFDREREIAKKDLPFDKNKYFWLKGLGTVVGLGILFYLLRQTDSWKKLRSNFHF